MMASVFRSWRSFFYKQVLLLIRRKRRAQRKRSRKRARRRTRKRRRTRPRRRRC
jgi:hypothetical protein